MSPSQALKTAPPSVPNVLIAFPADHVLSVTLNRAAQLNAMPFAQHLALGRLFDWYDSEPWLRCAVITGAGRAFCAGADLKEWLERTSKQPSATKEGAGRILDTGGFGGLSNRAGKKPVVAAVNGLCLGGGMEMVINIDIVIAAEGAKFGLPEVKRGVAAGTGALPRLASYLGRQRASEMALTGRMFTAEEMALWGLVNRVVPRDKLVEEALAVAGCIAENSPDSVIVSREGLKLGWEPLGPQRASAHLASGVLARLEAGENMKEGLLSFTEKRGPRWKDSKL
jgi:enoyl-CoA hydratase/carnithine racemase